MYTILSFTDNYEEMLDDDKIFSNVRTRINPIGGEIIFFVNRDNSLEKEIKKIKLKDYLKELKDLNNSELIEQEKIRLNYINKIPFNNINDIINNVDFIELDLNKIDELEYIKNNKILSNKKIIINEELKINDFDKINYLLNKYKDMEDKIFIKLEYNNFERFNLKDCLKTMIKIKELTDKIKKYHLSQLEKIMYAYDICKNKEYVEENKNESPGISRDLTNVLFGDKIVCEGFCNIFKALLNNLGIETKDDILSSISSYDKHIRIAINVDDKKYNVKGLYFFDPTNDCKISNNDNLMDYKFFARTKKQIDSDNSLINNHRYKNSPTDLKKLLKLLEKDENVFEKLIYYNWISKLCYLTNTDKIDISNINDETKEKLNILFSKLNNEISNEIMIKILYKIRKIECLEDGLVCSKNDLYLISKRSNFNIIEQESKEDKLIRMMYGIKPKDEKEIFYDFIDKLEKEKVLKLK